MLIRLKKNANTKRAGAYFCLGGAFGDDNCFLINRKSATNSAAAAMAEMVPMISHASHAGRVVSKYLREPMRRNKAADPASEIPSDINTVPTMLIISSFLMRFLKETSA